MSEQQSSQLLPGLFERLNEEVRVNVLHIGPALPETVEFFSGYRCKLFFVDLFAELPLAFEEGDELTVQQRMQDILDFDPGTNFDLCLFWDVFNYLDEECIKAFMACLRPMLTPGVAAHAFGVHNTRAAQKAQRFGILSRSELNLRPRPAPLPGYAPLPQARLQSLLKGLTVQRSVLLAESRLELLFRGAGLGESLVSPRGGARSGS
ncbi:hypothetical protein [Haliea sp. E17]|uniref:hypothetical protein n=1 Tax=Haliea sp. E17 TaxID=3401576 RepID=UPI003AACCEA5